MICETCTVRNVTALRTRRRCSAAAADLGRHPPQDEHRSRDGMQRGALHAIRQRKHRQPAPRVFTIRFDSHHAAAPNGSNTGLVSHNTISQETNATSELNKALASSAASV